MQFSRTDRFEVVMLMLTALCCSTALVSCGKTAKSRDAEKHAQEVAEQLKGQADVKAKAERAAADQKAREDALKAEEDRKKATLTQNAGTTPPAPGATKPVAPTTTAPTPIGVPVPNKDTKDNKDTTKGSTAAAPIPGPAGATGATGPAGPAGPPGAPAPDASGAVVQGVVAPGTPAQTGQTGGTGSVAMPSLPAKDQAALSADFASEALNLLDLGQAEATWNGCTVTQATLGQPAANQQAMKERFVVEKSGAFHRTRQLHQGADCATPVMTPEQLDGTIKIIAREASSTADMKIYKIDLRVPTFGAPAQQPGTTPTPAQENVIQSLIKIERQAGKMTFREPDAGGSRPATVDGGYILRHN